jgi:sugar/nucleoside kinase (ribokinase family)
LSLQVAVVGSATLDHVVIGEVSHFKWGGVPVYGGLAFNRMGLSTGVLTNIAARDRAIVHLLSNAGISVETGNTDFTTEFVNHVSGDERQQELLARATPISETQLNRTAANVDHVHLGPLHPMDIEPQALQALQEVERVSIDIQGYTRSVDGTDVLPGVSEHLPSALAQAHVVTASRDETEAVVGFYGAELPAIMKEHRVEQWLTTDGESGGWLLTRGGQRHDYRAAQVERVVDPTGAGDVFFAAYLSHHIYEDMSIDEALNRAAAVTARQVEGRFIAADELSRVQD